MRYLLRYFFVLVVALLLVFLAGLLPSPEVALAESPAAPQGCIPIEEAIQNNTAQASFVANGWLFWQEAVDYTVRNKSQDPITICTLAGLILSPEDPEYQNFIVGQGITLTLKVNEEKKGKLNVFCANLKRHAPEEGVVYTPQGMADGNLLQVAQTIERRKAYGKLGAQFAVWNITDSFSLARLNELESGGEGSELIDMIRPFLGLVSGELKLGQQILDEAAPGAVLYSGELPSDTGLPDLGPLTQIIEFVQSAAQTVDRIQSFFDRFQPSPAKPETSSQGNSQPGSPSSAPRTQQGSRVPTLVLIGIPLLCCIVTIGGIGMVIVIRRMW